MRFEFTITAETKTRMRKWGYRVRAKNNSVASRQAFLLLAYLMAVEDDGGEILVRFSPGAEPIPLDVTVKYAMPDWMTWGRLGGTPAEAYEEYARVMSGLGASP